MTISGASSGLRNTVAWHRRTLCINQETLAKAVGVSRRSISLIENGHSTSLVIALRLSHVFAVPVEKLFQLEKELS